MSYNPVFWALHSTQFRLYADGRPGDGASCWCWEVWNVDAVDSPVCSAQSTSTSTGESRPTRRAHLQATSSSRTTPTSTTSTSRRPSSYRRRLDVSELRAHRHGTLRRSRRSRRSASRTALPRRRWTPATTPTRTTAVTSATQTPITVHEAHVWTWRSCGSRKPATSPWYRRRLHGATVAIHGGPFCLDQLASSTTTASKRSISSQPNNGRHGHSHDDRRSLLVELT